MIRATILLFAAGSAGVALASTTGPVSGTDPAAAPGVVSPGEGRSGLLGPRQDVEALKKRFDRARGAERDEIFAALEEELPIPELMILISARAEERSQRVARSGEQKRLAKIADERAEIDRLREEVLGIILDEERYFTPYRVPEVTSDKAAEYREVQELIDDLTGDLAEAWDSRRSTKLSNSFREDVEDLRWTLAASTDLGVQPALHEDLAPWMLALDVEREEVDVRTFARTPEEATRLRRDDAVRDYNERVFEHEFDRRLGKDEDRLGRPEAEQVRVTNAYRAMMGRGALTFDLRLYRAARQHGESMTRTGLFSHTQEEDPERRTFGQRARLEGYPQPLAENLSLGRSAPEDAHEGWRHSSGHHRNLLWPHAREMASAHQGRYWVQVFGRQELSLETLRAEIDG